MGNGGNDRVEDDLGGGHVKCRSPCLGTASGFAFRGSSIIALSLRFSLCQHTGSTSLATFHSHCLLRVFLRVQSCLPEFLFLVVIQRVLHSSSCTCSSYFASIQTSPKAAICNKGFQTFLPLPLVISCTVDPPIQWYVL